MSDDESSDDAPAPITEADALKYLGKYVLVGITHEDASGNIVDQQQTHGIIERVTPGEVVVDPDYTTTWTIKAPQKH
jgi:hypothetical protein